MQRSDSGENSVIFNTDPFDTVISLGLKDASEKPSGVQSHQFKGTVGEIIFDDHTIPLWNFLSDDDQGMCKGYYRSHVDEPADKSYLFADGYIQIPATKPYRAQQTQLQLTFSTYSENGLIYFRGNPVSCLRENASQTMKNTDYTVENIDQKASNTCQKLKNTD